MAKCSLNMPAIAKMVEVASSSPMEVDITTMDDTLPMEWPVDGEAWMQEPEQTRKTDSTKENAQ